MIWTVWSWWSWRVVLDFVVNWKWLPAVVDMQWVRGRGRELGEIIVVGWQLIKCLPGACWIANLNTDRPAGSETSGCLRTCDLCGNDMVPRDRDLWREWGHISHVLCRGGVSWCWSLLFNTEIEHTYPPYPVFWRICMTNFYRIWHTLFFIIVKLFVFL